MIELTQARARALFDYNPETGDLIWKERPRSDFANDGVWKSTNKRMVGKVAGSFVNSGSLGYRQLCIGVKQHLAHRIIWVWVHGVMPECIDHINGDGTDNRLENLRSIKSAENMRNTKRCSRNVSGVTGLNWEADRGKWKAAIKVGGKSKTLGRYANFREAWEARVLAEIDNGYHPNHGRAA